MNFTKEGAYAENMANLFLIETSQGTFENFNIVSKQAFESTWKNFPSPDLSDEDIDSVRNYLKKLLKEWNQLPAGKTMIVKFEI